MLRSFQPMTQSNGKSKHTSTQQRYGYYISKDQEVPTNKSSNQGNEELSDTATSINGVPRNATWQIFIPVGHISLDPKNSDADKLELNLPPANVLWIKKIGRAHV